MTISRTVYNQLFEHTEETTDHATAEHVIRLRPTEAKAGAVVVSSKHRIQMWTKEEHERFLEALEMYPSGPWKKVADHIGTKTPRQTMTHAQKYRQKIYRRQRGLRNQKRSGESKMAALSPSSVTELNKNGTNNNNAHHHGGEPNAAANSAHSGFGLLDILAYSAAAAAQSGPHPHPHATNASVPPPSAPYQLSPQNNGNNYSHPHPPTPIHTVNNGRPPSPQQISPSNGVGRLCNNLPPLAQILQLRGSQVAQQ